jgi:hypothetical protein
MSTLKPSPQTNSKAKLSHWLVHEHEVTGVMFHDADDVISRWMHFYVLILHTLEAFAVVLILYALFTTECQVLAICSTGCSALNEGRDCTRDLASNASYTLTFDNVLEAPLARTSLWRFPLQDDARFTYCRSQGLLNNFVCIDACSTPNSLVKLHTSLTETLPFVSSMPAIKSVAWAPGELCANASAMPDARRDLLCARETTADCKNYLEEPSYWTTKALTSVASILFFSFMKPFLRLSNRSDMCAVWRWAGVLMCILLLVPLLMLMAVATYVGVAFVGNDATVWNELFVTLGLMYGIGHLLIVSPLKITIVWAVWKKCCKPKQDEDFIEMFE